jgi:2-methylcitrate dehydratase PrpD
MAAIDERLKNGVADYLAQLVHDIRAIGLTEEDRCKVRQHLLDGLSAAFMGGRSKEFRDLVGLTAKAGSGDAEGNELKHLQDTGMIWAFAINGSVSEDGSREGACHPAAVIVPVILALAEGKSWDLIDRAVIAGYDVMVRLARCGNPQFARKGFHATAITAPFGAAAAVAQLLEYDLPTTQHALCLAAMGGSGLMSSFKNGSTQPLQVAWGVRSGIAAALMAGKGNTGYPKIIEEGFFPAYLGLDASLSVLRPLDYDYAIRGCYLKPYPGCRHMHSSLEAFITIAGQHDIAPERIEKIHVGTYRIAIETEIKTLHRRGDAYFNIPYAIAAASVLGKSDYDAFDEKHFVNQRISQLVNKVSLSVDPEMEKLYPAQRCSRVEVRLVDGKTLSCTVKHPLGEPENPLPVEATKEKFRNNTRGLLSCQEQEQIERLLDISVSQPLPSGLSDSMLAKLFL